MNARLSALAIAVLGSMAMAASATVWSAADGNGTVPPFGKWYPYKSGTGAKADTSTVNKNHVLKATVSSTVETTAGFGFGWANKEAAIDLSAYQGVCLTYSATQKFRMDFKQSTIKDYNYNGVEIPAQSSIDTLYIPFSEFAQEDWGDETVEVAFDLTKQTGVQFGYKKSFATTSTTNTITISAISLGSSCSNHAPAVKATAATTADLFEGDTLKLAMGDIFADEDGDELNVVMSLDGDEVKDLTAAKSYGLSSTAMVKTVPNPTTGNTATVTLTATDPAGKSAVYKLVLTLTNRENSPVAMPDAYEVDEDSKLTVVAAKGVLVNDYDDDGDAFGNATVVTTTAHGELVLDAKGSFTYTPEPNFFGKDEFTYTISVGDDVSEPATVTITVKNVDDPATVTIKDSSFFVGEWQGKFADGLALDEDFEPTDVSIPAENVVFEDPDVAGSAFTANAKSVNGLFNVDYAKFGAEHVLSLTPVADANGADSIYLYAVDGKDTVGIKIPFTILPVADPPVAVADTFTVYQDSLNRIFADKGLLVNDFNPDGKSVLKSYMVTTAAHGSMLIDSLGAVAYEPEEGFTGEDSFTYLVVNEAGDSSAAVEVVLNVLRKNKGPQVVAGVMDTVANRFAGLKEDFNTSIIYKAPEIKSWFEDPEGDAIASYSMEFDSTMLSAVMTAVPVLTVRKVADACGETSIKITATDKGGATGFLEIPVSIACVNDKPIRQGKAIDTVYVPRAGWREAFYVFDLFKDVDDTVLTMTVSNADKILNVEVADDSLIVTLAEERISLQDKVPYIFKVNVADAAGATAVAKTITIMVGDKVGINPVVAVAKPTWQNAVRGSGVAALMDMQGRVMWTAKLPVSEADVRNASARVQGRKVLRVNSQVWTIK